MNAFYTYILNTLYVENKRFRKWYLPFLLEMQSFKSYSISLKKENFWFKLMTQWVKTQFEKHWSKVGAKRWGVQQDDLLTLPWWLVLIYTLSKSTGMASPPFIPWLIARAGIFCITFSCYYRLSIFPDMLTIWGSVSGDMVVVVHCHRSSLRNEVTICAIWMMFLKLLDVKFFIDFRCYTIFWQSVAFYFDHNLPEVFKV